MNDTPQKKSAVIYAVILLIIALLVFGYFIWYQGAQEDALDYGDVNISATQE